MSDEEKCENCGAELTDTSTIYQCESCLLKYCDDCVTDECEDDDCKGIVS